jgi:hypothetical protein
VTSTPSDLDPLGAGTASTRLGPGAHPPERALDLPPLRRARRVERHHDASRSPLLRLVAGLAMVGVVGWYALGAVRGVEVASAVVLIPVVAALCWPVFRRLARQERSFDLLAVLYLGLAAKFLGAYQRFQGAVDAGVYHQVGLELAKSFRQLDFSVDTGRKIPGTGSLRYLSGLVSVVTGTDLMAEFVVFTMFAFAGAVCFYLAFRTAVPDGDVKRYALVLFLWPSLAFWPSSVGKEAAMALTIGVASLGAARLFTHRRGGLVLLALGLLGTVMVRPHIGLIVVVAVAVAYLFVRSTSGSRVLSASKFVAIGCLLVGGAVIASQTAEFFDVDRLGTEQVDRALTETTEQTTEADGGTFTPARVSNPLDYPAALVTVVFRPFPNEASNTDQRISGLESLALVVLLAVSWRRLLALPKTLFSVPYVAYAVSYVLLFAYAFSAIGNFGILARQRTQMLPLLFVLIALPPVLQRGRAPRGVDPARRRPSLLTLTPPSGAPPGASGTAGSPPAPPATTPAVAPAGRATP